MRSQRAVVLAVSLLSVLRLGATTSLGQSGHSKAEDSQTNRTDGLAAWQQLYSVMSHPRCVNCHTASDYPQQGDDRHRHLFNVVRGPGGEGVPALQCATCHQSANADSTGVPGAEDWHLAPLEMKWQDTGNKIQPSPAVCKTVIENSGHNGPGLVKHHQTELVKWAWNPGLRYDGSARSAPPISYADFMAATRKWVEAGMPCPQ